MNNFWENKKIDEFSPEEWESLCDGCAKCCLHKLEDEDTGDVYYTAVACKLLNIETCRCTNYNSRSSLVPSCLEVDSNDLKMLSIMPETCSYRLIAEGKPLPDWHPLIAGNNQTIHEQEMSIKHFAFAEEHINLEDLEDFILE